MAQRWIDLDGLANMRDLGGLPTQDGGTTAPRRLIRSDNLQDLTAADVRRLVDEVGVSDVVDLRTETELHLDGPGPLHREQRLTHHHHSLMPAHEPRSADEVAARALNLAETKDAPPRDASFWAGHYLGYLERRPDSVSAALQVIARAEGAAVVHCAAGKDRTGTVVAMALATAGVPREAIVEDYVLSAERIDAIMDRLATRDAYAAARSPKGWGEEAPQAEVLETILTAVDDGWGGAPGWLRAQGWSQDEVAALRERLTRP